MHNKRFQKELGKFEGGTVSINNSAHKAFIERLKKQISSDDSSSTTVGADSNDGVVCSKELMKELEVKFDELFVDLDDDD